MHKLYKNLEAQGWVKTTKGECRSDDVVIEYTEDESFPGVLLMFAGLAANMQERGVDKVYRAPRPEYSEGTVVLAKSKHGKEDVTLLLRKPGKNADEDMWTIIAPDNLTSRVVDGEYWSFMFRKDSQIEVLKVIMNADGTTPEGDEDD